jgi:hypothetical protein
MDEAPGVKPAALFEAGTPFAPATVRFLIKSSAVRSPDFSIASRSIVKTGLGPTSSAVGMLDPVTMMRSASIVPDAGSASCAKANAAGKRKIATCPILV